MTKDSDGNDLDAICAWVDAARYRKAEILVRHSEPEHRGLHEHRFAVVLTHDGIFATDELRAGATATATGHADTVGAAFAGALHEIEKIR